MSDRMTTTLTRPVDVLLDIPSDAPRWYRHWIVLEAYIRAVVCWGQYRYNYYTTHFPPREGSCINYPAMCEGEVIGEIQRECLARGYSNWYGPFRNVRGL